MPTVLAFVLVFATSAAVLILEILGARLFAPYFGVSLETYTGIIGTVLAGIAFGNWWGGRLADRREPRTLLGPTIAFGGLLAVACLPIVRLLGPALGSQRPIAIVTLAFLGYFAPAAVLSAVTPMVVKVQLNSLVMTGRTVGQLSAIGTVGAIFGTFVTGFFLLAAFPTPPIVVTVGAMLVVGGIALRFWLARGGSGVAGPSLLLLGTTALAVVGVGIGTPCQQETAYFCASVAPDPDNASGRVLVLDTHLHSYVDLDDPTHLQFEYARSVADVIDAQVAPPEAVDVLHIGGGGFTLPTFLAAARPGSSSVVLEIDPEIVHVAREQLGLRTSDALEVISGDARLGIVRLPTDSRDIVIGDAFGSLAVPWHLTTGEFIAEVQRVLRPGGVYVLNLIDHPPSAFARAETATVAAAFAETAVVAPPERLQGSLGGNFIVVAGDDVAIDRIQERLDERAAREMVVVGEELERFVGDAIILTDDYAPVEQLITPRPVATDPTRGGGARTSRNRRLKAGSGGV